VDLQRRFTDTLARRRDGRPRWPVRVEERVGTDPPYVTGIAAPFYQAGDQGTEYWLDEDLVERIMPGCFDRACRECDVRMLFNHDPSFVLGRTRAGTLALTTDSVGLRYRVQLPDTQVARDLATSIRRGDITGSSFAFVPYPGGARYRNEGKVTIRELTSVQLFDVSVVTYPAYGSTTAGAAGAAPQANSQPTGASTADLVALVEHARRGLAGPSTAELVAGVKRERRKLRKLNRRIRRNFEG
jgi:HK97 family phage prohead protease